MRRSRVLVLALGGIVACQPEAADQSAAEPAGDVEARLPEMVRIADPGLHPEGIEYDAARGRFLVSSVTRGTVTAVGDDGTHSVFIDDADIVSSIGIHIDETRDRLLVANSNVASFQGGDGHARLGAYDLETGERIFMADLGAAIEGGEGLFANDMTVGPDGTAYVTDSLTPVIYTVTGDGEVGVLLRDGPLAEGGFLNGIDYHPDGYLLVALSGASALVRISLGPVPVVSPVEIPEPLDIDGLALAEPGTLIAVAGTGDGDGRATEVLRLTSEDGWATASVASRWIAAEVATTAAIRGDDVYVVDARFGDMQDPEPAPHFDITRVRFP